ncbi:unnamed protein product [Commensalibacter communis]|uniref:hypothetical protein n=1 Tax=Commensalibacter communis TaxID=2972786 RepID=UPI0022FF89D7|nr:hypothetical protein [Commensalibacter communis]CAI3959897.1 unnamed protein product [Commensalibacter communis]CAI3960528.1 unnamed protein product [Commensalibacter communis]CAI3961115.1 unnamed protein product [Commensalibacter communis]
MSSKNKINLDGLVSTKGNSNFTSDMPTRSINQSENNEEKNNMPLNFRVSSDFRRRFRMFAASHDLKLNELLVLVFDQYEKNNK